MGKQVELPVSEPMFNTYGFQIISTAVFDVNPTLRNWAMNSLIFLSCNPNFLVGLSSSPEVFVNKSGYQDCPYLELSKISLKFLGSKFQDVIRAMLDDGCYVYYSNIDNSIIRKKNPHHRKLFAQSGIICGYDQEAGTYSTLTCDETFNCSVMKIPQRWLELGRKKSLSSDLCGTLCSIRPKTTTVELNVKEIYQNLKNYIKSDYQSNPPYQSKTEVCGSIVHDYIAMYLNYLIEGILPYEKVDPAVFRQIWEHKRCMFERLKKVEDKLKLNHSISDKYYDLVLHSEQLRDEYKLYCEKKNNALLLEIRDQIVAIGRQEQLLLRQFVVDMEEAMG